MTDIQTRIDFWNRSGKLLSKGETLEHILTEITDEIIHITGAEQGYLYRLNENKILIPFVKRDKNKEDISQEEITVPRAVIDLVLQQKKGIISHHVPEDDRLRSILSIRAYGVKSLICIPIQVHHKNIGILYLHTVQRDAFDREDLQMLEALTPTLGYLLENEWLHHVALEKARMQREMQMARDVQDSLVPREIPQHKGWDAAFCWQPAFEAGGDFFDFITVDEHTLALVIADVSDKGMPAALFMALSRTILRAVVGNHGTPAEMITRANRLIHHDAQEGMFVTLFFGLLDLENGKLTYVNGGHNPPFFYQKKVEELQTLNPTGMAVGIEDDFVYKQKSISMEPGDFLFLYTDGALDAVVRQQPFNEEELQSFIQRHRNADPTQLVSMLKESLCGVNGGAGMHDDLTLVMWKRRVNNGND